MKTAMTAGKPSGSKLMACLLITACAALGALGLILPVIPGLVFLAIAAVIAAKHFPWLDARLRRHPAFGKHLNEADRFFGLGFGAKVRVAGWLCLKAAVDSLAALNGLMKNGRPRRKSRLRPRDRRPL